MGKNLVSGFAFSLLIAIAPAVADPSKHVPRDVKPTESVARFQTHLPITLSLAQRNDSRVNWEFCAGDLHAGPDCERNSVHPE
jgi:hypothetical protein